MIRPIQINSPKKFGKFQFKRNNTWTLLHIKWYLIPDYYSSVEETVAKNITIYILFYHLIQ